MKSAQDFLLAAKHCEIEALEQLRTTCELVTGLSELIHSLQRERGASNVYLGSAGLRFGQVLQHQVIESSRTEKSCAASFPVSISTPAAFVYSVALHPCCTVLKHSRACVSGFGLSSCRPAKQRRPLAA